MGRLQPPGAEPDCAVQVPWFRANRRLQQPSGMRRWRCSAAVDRRNPPATVSACVTRGFGKCGTGIRAAHHVGSTRMLTRQEQRSICRRVGLVPVSVVKHDTSTLPLCSAEPIVVDVDCAYLIVLNTCLGKKYASQCSLPSSVGNTKQGAERMDVIEWLQLLQSHLLRTGPALFWQAEAHADPAWLRQKLLHGTSQKMT